MFSRFGRKVYTLYKQENFDAFVNALDIPEDNKKMLINHKPVTDLHKNDDTSIYSLCTTRPDNDKAFFGVSFKDGEELEEHVLKNMILQTTVLYNLFSVNRGQQQVFRAEDLEVLRVKTIFTVDGNTVTQVQKFPDGLILTFIREYSDKELVETITSSNWPGIAKRYYFAKGIWE